MHQWAASSTPSTPLYTASGFPGESAGLLTGAANWRPINIATMSYGYGLSVTPLQLAQAYATIGAGGIHRPVTFRRAEAPRRGPDRRTAWSGRCEHWSH